MAKSARWMSSAVKRPGALLREKAQRAGMPTSEYAREHAHDSGRTGKQARLAQTFAKFRGGRKSRKGRKSSRSSR